MHIKACHIVARGFSPLYGHRHRVRLGYNSDLRLVQVCLVSGYDAQHYITAYHYVVMRNGMCGILQELLKRYGGVYN
jgi:hypothetical protein